MFCRETLEDVEDLCFPVIWNLSATDVQQLACVNKFFLRVGPANLSNISPPLLLNGPSDEQSIQAAVVEFCRRYPRLSRVKLNVDISCLGLVAIHELLPKITDLNLNIWIPFLDDENVPNQIDPTPHRERIDTAYNALRLSPGAASGLTAMTLLV